MNDRKVCGEMKMSLGYEEDANTEMWDKVIWVPSDVNAREVRCEERRRIVIWRRRHHFVAAVGQVLAETWIFAVRKAWECCSAESSLQDTDVRDTGDSSIVIPDRT